MSTPRFFARARLLPSGDVLVIGGTSDGSTGLTSTTVFSPARLATDYELPITNPDPGISASSPLTTIAGDSLTLTGSGFFGSSEVLVDGNLVPSRLLSPTQLTLFLPDVYGSYAIAVRNPSPGGGVSSSIQQIAHVAMAVGPLAPQWLPNTIDRFTTIVRGGGTVHASVREGSGCGTIGTSLAGYTDDFGAYDAPATPAVCHVDFLSSVDPTVTATATVTISSTAVHATAITLSAPHGQGLAASLLSDGEVLITGGGVGPNGSAPSSAADLYDASAKLARALPPMGMPRFFHSSLVLANHRVLLVGGYTTDATGKVVPTASAELFDPTSKVFAPTGALSLPRGGQAAAQLPSGDALIIGGCNAATGRTTEIYRVQMGIFDLGPVLKFGRCGSAATTLKSGQILVTGGFDPASQKYSPDAELYDSSANAFEDVGPLPVQPRSDDAVSLFSDGRVLFTAGDYDQFAGTTELYDPVSQSRSAGPDLAFGRFEHTATLLSAGIVAVAGGYSIVEERHEGLLTIAQKAFQHVLETWSPAGTVAVATVTGRAQHVAIALPNGSLFLIGGSDETSNASESADVITFGVPIPPLPAPSLDGCVAIKSNYFECYGYDIEPGDQVVIDGSVSPANVFSSERFVVNLLSGLSSGNHEFQVQSGSGKTSNVVWVAVP